tara:strand:- start:68 stop:1225 length:1158 start_codon:yes stop_codon:yes gene_type:complete
MNENSKFTLYDLVLLIYKAKLFVFVCGIISVLISVLILTFWSGEPKYSVGYNIFNASFKIEEGSAINQSLDIDGFKGDYLFKQFYTSLQSLENFKNSLDYIKSDLASTFPEFKLKNSQDKYALYSQYNFETEVEKDFSNANIFISTSTNFSNIEVEKFIMQSYIEFTSKVILNKLNTYYKNEKISAISEIDRARLKHKEKIKNEIDREIYSRDFKIEGLLMDFDTDIIAIEENISIARLMGYIEPVMATPSFPFESVPEYFYGVKILEKKLENLLSNKDKVIQNKIKNHKIKINNYEKTYADAFILEMDYLKDNIENIQNTLDWIANSSNSKNIFINYDKNDPSIKKISRSKFTKILISLVLGMLFGFLIYIFRLENSKRNIDLS